MLPTKDEIVEIIQRTVSPYSMNTICGEEDAAEAIVTKLERARLVLELLADSNGDDHQIDECVKAARELMGREEAT